MPSPPVVATTSATATVGKMYAELAARDTLPPAFKKKFKKFSFTEEIAIQRDIREHKKYGHSVSGRAWTEKGKLWDNMWGYRRKQGHRVYALMKKYSGLKKVDSSKINMQLGLMMSRLHAGNPRIEMEMARIHQNTFVEQYRDQQLSLTTTHVYFADIASVTIVVNSSHKYMYGKVLTNKGAEVDVFNPDGVFTHFDDRPELKELAHTLEKVARRMRLFNNRKKEHTMHEAEAAAALARPQLEQDLFDSKETAAVTHSVSFADCADDSAGDLPDDLQYAEAEAEAEAERKRLRQLQRDSQPVVVDAAGSAEEALAKRLLASNGMSHIGPSGSQVPPSELVRPLFSVYIEPFLHHMTPLPLLEALPPSTVWKNRIEYIGMEHSRLLQAFQITAEHRTSLSTTHLPFPEPPREQAQISLGAPNMKMQLEDVRVSTDVSLDRNTYSGKVWKGPDYTKGYVPKRAASYWSVEAGTNADDDDDDEEDAWEAAARRALPATSRPPSVASSA